MHRIDGLADIEVSCEENYPGQCRQPCGALLGISETDIANAVLFSRNGNGQTDPIIYTDPQNGNEYYISAWLAEEHRKDLTDLENIILTARNGEPVLLKNVASLKLNAGPVKIDRKYFQRVIHITANPLNRDLGAIAEDLEAGFAQLQLPTGFSIRLAGQIQQQRETFSGLLFATVLALVLVYGMVAQFKSLGTPSSSCSRFPWAFRDDLALFLTNTTLSTTSMMGASWMLGTW
jgi:multidrug efflux pump subunit AcrB